MTIAPIKRKKYQKTNLSVILLSDYSNDKLKSTYPMSLSLYGGNHLIDIQMAAIRSSFDPSCEIVICSGIGSRNISNYMKKKYRGDNIRIIENKSYEEEGSVEGLRLALNNINNNYILVIDGALLLYPEALTPFTNENFVLCQRDKSLNLEIGVAIDEHNVVTNFSYGLNEKWSEIFYLNNYDDIEKLRNVCSVENSGNKMVFEILNESKIVFQPIFGTYPIIKIVDPKTRTKIRKMYENTDTGLFVRSF